jgi:transcriptional regulator with XRE-family HTH domain
MGAPTAEHRLIGLKEAREAIGLSQFGLADDLSQSRSTIAKIEKGETARLSTIYKIFGDFSEAYADKFLLLEINKKDDTEFEIVFTRKENSDKNQKFYEKLSSTKKDLSDLLLDVRRYGNLEDKQEMRKILNLLSSDADELLTA